MNKLVHSTLLLSASLLLALPGCNKKEDEAKPAKETPSATAPAPTKAKIEPAKPKMPAMPDKSADVAHAAEVWTAVQKYREWNKGSEAPVAAQKPHGAFVHVFYNDISKAAIGGEGAWPDGSIFVKDNFMPNETKDGPGPLAAVTVMHKEGDKWFWGKFKPDGTLHKTPANHKMPNMPIAGYEKLKCIGCHDGLATRDMVVTKIAPAK